MGNFTKAVEKVLEHEGGYVNNPADTGGATNFGITKRVYESFIGRPVSLTEMKVMPKGNAVAIYKANYWDKVKGDFIKSYSKAFILFDQAVNRGPSSAIKQAQRISGALPDGVIGPKTIEAINKMNEKSFIDNFVIESEKFYRSLVARKPSQAVFLNGWLNRVKSLEEYAYQNRNKIAATTAILAGAGAVLYLKNKNKKKKS